MARDRTREPPETQRGPEALSQRGPEALSQRGPEALSQRGPDLKRLARQMADMETERAQWIPTWKEIAQFIIPGRGVFDKSEPNQGDRKDYELLDPTPLHALHVLSAGLQGGLTSPSRPWFRLSVSDGDLADYMPVRLWLNEVERRMMRVLSQSNVYNSLHMLYQEIGAFGVGCMLMEEDVDNAVRAQTLTAGEYCLSYGVNGLPNRFCRAFWMTAQQMADQFGEEGLSEGAWSAYRAGRMDQWFRICHMIYPDERPRYGMPYLSVYWEEGRLERPLSVERYREFPVLAPRWEVVGSDFYGRGPGHDALGESKMLQEMRVDQLDAQKMAIRPPVVAPNTIREARPDLRPGGVTLVNDMKNPNQFFRPIYQVRPDTEGQTLAIQDSRASVRETFFADLFLAILRSPDRDMTATQVNAITNEQMMMIGPVYERLNHELLDPFIGRTFGLMDRQGLIPPPPEELSGQELKIEYISMLAQAQQMVGLGGVDRLTQFIGAVAEMQAGAGVHPDVLDKFNADKTVDRYAQMLGVEAAIVRSDEDAAAMRQERQQAAAQAQRMAEMQQMAQSANAGAGALKQAGDAAAGGGLDALAGMIGLGAGQGAAM